MSNDEIRDFRWRARRPVFTPTYRAKPLFDVVCLLCGVLALILMSVSANAEPYRPTEDAAVLEVLPRPVGEPFGEVQRLRDQLAGKPENLPVALRLARHYMQMYRSEADPRYVGYAQAALGPWWSLPRPPADVLLLRAHWRQSRHDFKGALDDLARVLSTRPRDPQALLTRSFVLQAQGEVRGAAEACDQLPARVLSLVQAICTARVESLTGAAEAAYARLSLALAAAPNADGGLRLWTLTNLAEIAQRRGDDAAAERHFRAALDLGERSAYLLDAYADWLLDQGRAADVRALFDDDSRADGHLLRLTIAEKVLDHPDYREHAEILRARFAASRRRGESIHLREEARFEQAIQGRPGEALTLAIANWQTQREPWDARLVLETALAAGKPHAARSVLAWLEETRLEDVHLQALAAQVRGASS